MQLYPISKFLKRNKEPSRPAFVSVRVVSKRLNFQPTHMPGFKQGRELLFWSPLLLRGWPGGEHTLAFSELAKEVDVFRHILP